MGDGWEAGERRVRDKWETGGKRVRDGWESGARRCLFLSYPSNPFPLPSYASLHPIRLSALSKSESGGGEGGLQSHLKEKKEMKIH